MNDDDNSKLFAQPRVCLDCEERFTLGEMYPGKRYTDPMQCPHCRSENTIPRTVPLTH